MGTDKLDDIEKSILRGDRLFRPSFDGEDFTAFRLRKGKLIEASFMECRFDRVDASEAYLPNSRFVQCTIINSLFAGTYLRGATFDKCVFEATDFGSALFAESKLIDCTIIRCRMDQSDFADCVIKDVKAYDSTFFLADFTRVDLSFIEPIKGIIRGGLLPAGA